MRRVKSGRELLVRAFLSADFLPFGSQSRTGTLAVLVSFCIGGVKYRNKVCQYKRTILCVLVSVFAILFFCNGYITGDIFGKWQQVRFSTKGSKKLSYIETKDNHVKIRYKKKIILLS